MTSFVPKNSLTDTEILVVGTQYRNLNAQALIILIFERIDFMFMN